MQAFHGLFARCKDRISHQERIGIRIIIDEYIFKIN